MPIGLLFWVLMVIWFIFGLYWNWPADQSGAGILGGHVLLFILFFLVGWKIFGFVVQG